MADSRWQQVGRACLVALLCALVVVPALVAMALDEDVPPHAAAPEPRVHRERPETTTTVPTTTTVAPAPPPTNPPPEEPPPGPPPATDPPRVAQPAPAPVPEPEPAASACGGGGDVVGLHNAARCSNGLGGLAYDGGISANAQAAANRLLGGGSCGAMTHSDLAGVYAGRSWGENLGCDYSSGGCIGSFGEMMGTWMASSGHAANILNPSYTRMGYGSACDGYNNYFVVQFTS